MQSINGNGKGSLMYELIDPKMEQGVVAVLTHDKLKDKNLFSLSDNELLRDIMGGMNKLRIAMAELYAPEMHFDSDHGMLIVDSIITQLMYLRQRLSQDKEIKAILDAHFVDRTYVPVKEDANEQIT